MRVLLESYSAATRSSYGIVTRNIWTRLLQADPTLEVMQHGWFPNGGVEKVPWQIIPTKEPPNYHGGGEPPIHEDSHGMVSLRPLLEQSKPDCIWLLADPWHNPLIAELKKTFRYKLIHYCPVDSEPYPARFSPYIASAEQVVAMTNYGKNVLRQVPGLNEVDISVIPHGYDPTMFNQLPKAERKNVRKQVAGDGDFDDKTFILGWVGRDQFRKQTWQLFAMMFYIRSGEWIRCKKCGRITVKEYDANTREIRTPVDNRVYERGYNYSECWYCRSKDITKGSPRTDIELWTHMVNRPDTGYDLPQLAYIYRCHDSIYNPAAINDDRGVPTEALNALYNAMDAFVFPTGGEGFGLPVLEAMACGVPTIYSNYSAHAEFAVGLPVRCSFFPETRTQRFRALVDMGDLLTQVFEMKRNTSLRSQLSKRSVKVASKMTWDHFTNDWLRVMDRMRKREISITYGEVV